MKFDLKLHSGAIAYMCMNKTKSLLVLEVNMAVENLSGQFENVAEEFLAEDVESK